MSPSNIWKVQYLNYEKFLSLYDYNKQELLELKNGTILISNDKEGLFIKAKDGIVSVIEIQGENAKKMNIKDFLRGNKLEINKIFK